MSNKLREAAQAALELAGDVVTGWESLAPLAVRRAAAETLDALRAALDEPTCKSGLQVAEQEPVAWMHNLVQDIIIIRQRRRRLTATQSALDTERLENESLRAALAEDQRGVEERI